MYLLFILNPLTNIDRHTYVYTDIITYIYINRSHMLPSWKIHKILCMNMIQIKKKIALANIKETRTAAAAYVDINKNLGREFSYNVLS